MNTTIDATDVKVVLPVVPACAEASELLPLASTVKPNVLVLQPDGALNQASSHAFQQELESTLEQVTDGVIVDLLRVDSTDAHGITALVTSIQRAAALGKWLSFQSMNASDCLALEAVWSQQQEFSSGTWKHTFSNDLEGFLDRFTHK